MKNYTLLSIVGLCLTTVSFSMETWSLPYWITSATSCIIIIISMILAIRELTRGEESESTTE